MLYNKKISLIIPCKNEEAALYSMLQKIPTYIDEVIVVDNNSSDNSVRVAWANGATVYKEKRHIGGTGYGFAHQTGIKRATGDYIIAMDGDDTYPVESVQEVITYMKRNDLDFVSCNRLPLIHSEAITFVRRLGIHILNLWIGVLFGYYFIDILSGMWIMKKEIADKLHTKSGDWNFSPEIKLAALYNNQVRFSEYHIPYTLRMNGRSKLNMFRTGFSHFIFILKRRLTIDNAFQTVARPLAKQTVIALKGLLALLIIKNS